MYTVEIFFTHFAIWVKISPLGGGAHKISVQKQVRTAAQGLVLIFAKVVNFRKSSNLKTRESVVSLSLVMFLFQ